MAISYKHYAQAVDKNKAKQEAEEDYAYSEANKGNDNKKIDTSKVNY